MCEGVVERRVRLAQQCDFVGFELERVPAGGERDDSPGLVG